MPDAPASRVREVLAEAVSALGGAERPGQVAMAEAVSEALESQTHLLVQAGTGTGKSLGYLVPSLLHRDRVVIATATLALQHQLVERDLPRLMDAIGHHRDIDTSYAVLKGRSNYACLHRIREGVPDDQGVLVEAPVGSLGEQVIELREWAEDEAKRGLSGERDNAPRHTERVWRQVSVSARECLGKARCAFGEECFAERAKEKAASSQLVVTNHSLLAIDAIEGIPMIPEYDAVVIDEAHELVARVTQAASSELAPGDVERAGRRAARQVDGREADELLDAADALADAISELAPGRIERMPVELADALALVRDAARACVSAFPKEKAGDDADAARTQAKAMVGDVLAVAERMAADLESDVLWRNDRLPQHGGPQLCLAPLQVWGQIRDKLLADKTVVFTSATLMLGGDFGVVASSLGLKPTERVADGAEAPPRGDGVQPWRGFDVGSPFDYGKQGILYVARHLPQPGRDGLVPAVLDEIVELIDAADGRTLGLFSSKRAADAAAEEVRTRLPHLTTLAQGDAQLPELAKQFVEDPHTVLFGTLSLWQGLDVPGDTCTLVLIDRIPFPRPDDPLMSARQKAADKAGVNGFMSVAATHAALLMAQGAGRLIRTSSDRGVVAVLDPRLATARYGGFLRASLPPMWPTVDPQMVRGALKRLAGR
ncbi:ATP-dependent DNA helicase [Nocardioides jiangxiensis]|uniref:ATP-dependent DNA helicase n=1 Tax=Nocardioides jiangxiensis TaxID=3064524 RepID=UPI003F716638